MTTMNSCAGLNRAAFEYSLRTDSDLGSDATPTLQAFYYFAWSLEENMDATRKAVVAVAVFLMWQVVAAGEKTTTFAKPKER